MRCPHCDDPIDEWCIICPNCNKDPRPVSGRAARPETGALKAGLAGVKIVEDLQATAVQRRSGTTKRCPFCAEDILAEAIVCKHCRRDINSSTEALPFKAVPGQVVTSGVMYFLAAFASILISIFVLGTFGPILLVLITSIWAGADAGTHKISKYEQGLGGPATVFFGSLLLWILVFPWYLAIRSRIRAGVQPVRP